MRPIAIALGVLLAAAGCASAQNQLGQLPSFRQVCTLNSSGTCTLHDPVPSGDIEFIAADNFNNTFTTPTTLLSGTTSLAASYTGNSMKVYLWCKVTTSSGTESATMAGGSVSFVGGFLVDFPNPLGYTCSPDANTSGATNSTNPETTTGLTSSQNVDLAVCYFDNFHNGGTDIPNVADGWNHIGFTNGSDGHGFGFKYLGTNASGNTCKFDIDQGADNNASWVFALFKTSSIQMVTTALPTAALSNTYDATVQCAGGVGAYTWAASGLPSGLTINSSTGKITGTPTTGTSTPTITCTDGSSNTATLSQPLTVNSSANTPAIVSFSTADSSGSGVTTTNLGTVAAGNCILVAAEAGSPNDNPVFLPTDNLSAPTVYRMIGTFSVHNGTSGSFHDYLAVWGGVATASGSDIVTGPISVIGAVQISNCQMFFDAVSVSTGVNTGSATITGSSVTTLAPNSTVLGFITGWSSGTTWTAGTGFTADTSIAGNLFGEDAVKSAVGSYAPIFSQSSNSDGRWLQWTLALRPGTSGVVAGGVLRHKSQIL